MTEPITPIVKICGIRDSAMARVAIDAGATAIGYMFAPSRRQVTPEAAAAILAELGPVRADAVGVVVNLEAGEINALRETTGIDVIQLSGDEEPTILCELTGRIWKAVRFAAGTTPDEARRAIEPWLLSARPAERILVDAAVAGAYGGTGHRADWDLVARLSEDYPVILAGGLNPANAGLAIAAVRPSGVDVSSGVERDGAKDGALIREFVMSATRAFAEVPDQSSSSSR